jgi:hypothetical protein
MTVEDFAETCRAAVGRLRQKGEADLLFQVSVGALSSG